ncbi:MAG: SDR family NAD(P)-dependent oxidoreductase [Sphingobium sp.]|nr:SDR family NAD(P)-dependent oxidoreductase [Sphingobium sp.]
MKSFHDRVAVVTGAAAGIGRALAEALTKRGAKVLLADFDEVGLADVAAQLDMPALRTDVARPEDMVALADLAQAQFGQVDLLCNNAGVGRYAGFDHLSPTDWQWIMDVNFWGIRNGLTAFMPMLRANENGAHILNTVSLQGLYVFPGSAAYAASKYAALALTEALDAELRQEGSAIHCTAFCPGPIATDIATSGDRRPARYGAVDAVAADSIGSGTLKMLDIPRMPAAQAADIALDAVERGDFWCFTHPEYLEPFRARNAAIEAAAQRS